MNAYDPQLIQLMNQNHDENKVKILFGTAVLMSVVGKAKLQRVIERTSGNFDDFKERMMDFVFLDKDKEEIFEYVFNQVFTYLTEDEDLLKIIMDFSQQISEEMLPQIAVITDAYHPMGYNADYLENSSPYDVIRLGLRLMAIQDREGKSFLDFCCGFGNSIAEVGKTYKNLALYGQDLKAAHTMQVRARMALLGKAAEIKTGDVIKDPIYGDLLEAYPKAYDYIFIQPPFGYERESREILNDIESWKYHFSTPFNVAKQNESIFASVLLNHLAEGGKGCLLAPINYLNMVTIERKWREELIQGGFLEAVIKLPLGVITNNNESTALFIFSHDNKGVKFIDATEAFELINQQVIMTDEKIEEVSQAFFDEKDDVNAVFKSKNEISEADYALDPSEYLTHEVGYHHLEALNKDDVHIGFGFSMRNQNIDFRYNNVISEFEALHGSDYDFLGEVGELKRIRGIDKEFKKFLVQKGDLILTIEDRKFKTMVADFEEDRKVVLVAQSMYLFRFLTDRWNPYYIKMILDSQFGRDILEKRKTLRGIRIKDFYDLELPYMPKAAQDKLVNIYFRKRAQYHDLKKAFEDAAEGYYHFYDEMYK